jgi:hypothetical protein
MHMSRAGALAAPRVRQRDDAAERAAGQVARPPPTPSPGEAFRAEAGGRGGAAPLGPDAFKKS